MDFQAVLAKASRAGQAAAPNGGEVSEWDEFLEWLARELAAAPCVPSFAANSAANDFKPMLRAKLVPLLEAGQAMRQNIGAYAVALNAKPFKQADTMSAIGGCVNGLEAWDAALKADKPLPGREQE